MAKYIDVQELIKNIPGLPVTDVVALLNYVGKLPCADVAPVLHGKWKRLPYSRVWHKCTACGSAVNTDEPEMWQYCPHCGAKMEVENDSTSKDADSIIAKGYAYTERFPFDGQPPKVLDVLKEREK